MRDSPVIAGDDAGVVSLRGRVDEGVV